jgi:peptidoglycan/xylan/chitin deacetylase (PgdA/CDA1 family)
MMPSLRLPRTGGAVLCFHSVTTPELSAEGSAHVPVDTFKSFIRIGRRLGEFVPLAELVRRHAEGRSTAGLLAVTFDDAYAAVLTELADFISAQSLPITVFVTTEAAATGARFWWDRIDDLYTRLSPARWRAFEDACGLPEEYRQGQPRMYGPLRPFRQWMLASFAGRWPDRLEAVLRQLEQELGYRPVHRSMTYDELAVLQRLPGVDIGVHTVTHPVLPLLPDADLQQEIETAHAALRERFCNVVPMLAVPFGLYDQRLLRRARSSGLAASLTLAGTMGPSPHDGAIPRLCLTTNDSAIRFGIRLSGLADLVRSWSRPRLVTYPDLPSPTT